MVKVSSRDLLGILRRFELADDDNVPRNIENVKITQPNPISTLVSFRFNKNLLYVLFDDAAEDDVDYISNQIKSAKSTIKGELIKNPRDSTTTYEMPYKGKGCYLFNAISDKRRLDGELAERYPENSRSTWQKYIKAGYVSVNSNIVLSSKFDVTENDKIAINIPEASDYSKNELPIVYIDDNVIVINKPIGVLSHAKGVLNDEFTVADFFRRYSTYNSDTNRPGIIHRLDRDTSGIMIGARNAETANLLQKQFADRKTKKTYYAVVDGLPKLAKANINLPIIRNPSAPSTFKVDSNGKSAITKYEVLASNDKYSLVKLQPQTGRTHQLRVHMRYIGTPIHGDKVYGKASDRLYLHAHSLEITIPNGNRQTFVTPVPTEFTNFFPGIKL
ncbi:MAG: RluA family pseudouridine synthase [Candidatus Saccharibacteria bacterium]